uniref:Putative glycosyltransferase n=1 Tax=viral metagenome TaxID=1070528 RepID=A0A6M3J2K6_9ZZZZ
MDLSIVIPSRNEMFLGKTIENILENIEGKTEVIAVCDGYEVEIPEIPKDDRVHVIELPKAIGQRASTNLAVKCSKAKYVMKMDAHCSIDKGMDVKMMADMHDDWTFTPLMRNLWAFDWKCPDGHTRYQSPSGPCKECGKETEKDIKWIGKDNPKSTSYRFDTDMHFQYWKEWQKAHKEDITETMSLQGSCFMVTRHKYLELDLCSEDFKSWGQQGVEVACKTWLSGGSVMVNHKTWYAHMFRTQGGDFSFPYRNPGNEVVANRAYSKDLFAGDKWPLATRKFQWLIDKFNPPGWGDAPTKGILYYTTNQLDERIAQQCRDYLIKAHLPITSVSLKPLEHFGNNIVLDLEPGLLTMTKQILAGLEAMKEDVVFMAEHDVLYHPTHYLFTPEKKDVYYYNTNSWMLRLEDGHGLFYEHQSLSGMVAYRETLLTHYRERLRRIEALIAEAEQNDGQVHSMANPENLNPLKEGIHRLGFEPGTHTRKDKVDELWNESFNSEFPNIDMKHKGNLTQNRWRVDQFRDKSVSKTWKEIENYEIEGWNDLDSLIDKTAKKE